MRSFVVMAMFLASFSHAAWTDYEEVRDLSLDADGIGELDIRAGAGSLDVTGVAGQHNILVKATIVVADADEDDAARIIAERMELSLEERDGKAVLTSDFDSGFMGAGPNARIDLEVTVPASLPLKIDDGSGSIDVRDVLADVRIDDGSGSIDVENVANLRIDDGSGSIDVERVAGDVNVEDGSGSISVRGVSGSVTIDDGSGSIRVNDVEEDLIIVDDGSGGLKFSNVRGTVKQDT